MRKEIAHEELIKPMRLHILGCGDAFGSGGRNQSGYLIEAAERLFLLDCGPTTLPAMKRAAIEPRRLDAILLSHLHGDHFGGVPFFLIEYLYHKPPHSPLTIAGPPGKPSPRSFATLSNASPAASSRVCPTSAYSSGARA